MKKHLIFATALAALASCSSDNFVGESPNAVNGQIDGAIMFSSTAGAITRTDLTGAQAAEKLGNTFVVSGFKGATSVATTTVFDNYNVSYTANTANTTESNTNNWEYVGLDVNPLASIYNSSADPADKQTIKYWDYSQAQYDFIAYSLGGGGATVTRILKELYDDPSAVGYVAPDPTSSTVGAYKLSGTTAQLGTVYISDLKTVLKANYNEPVQLSFRSLVSKVRIALYETVPGYSVKDVKFYTSDAAISGGSTSATAALYTSSSVLPTEGTYTVYFPTVNNSDPASDKNKAHVSFTTSTATQTNQTFGTLEESGTLVVSQRYEHKEDDSETSPTKDASTKYLLGRESNHATYAGTSPYYQDVLPLETGTALTLKVDYTLVSIDGTGENIKVVGAKAVVPAIYAKWKPGYAYTYIFKISDNTNGWSSRVESTDLAGLHSITFDAVVESATTDNVQETVTTVATPSITTYQHVPAINASANDEYKAGDIYVMVMDGGTPKTDLNGTTTPAKDGAKLYTLSDLATEAEVMEALNMQTSVDGSGNITGRNGLVLTVASLDNTIEAIPGADGNNITVTAGTASKFTASASTNYAYVYTVTQATGDGTVKSEAVSLTTAPTGWPTGYYTDAACGTAAPSTFEAGTYYVKYTQNNGVYAVKVIKVASGS